MPMVAAMSNPFDQYDDDDYAGAELSSSPGWEPTWGERFWGNVADSQRYTPEGAIGSAGLQKVGPGAGSLEVEEAERERADIADYEAMAPSDSLLDYVAATGGQVVGSVTPSGLLNLPVRVAARVAPALKPVAKEAIDRALGTAAANVGLDVATQGIRIATDQQDEFDPLNTVVSLAVGAGLGAGSAYLPGGRVAEDAVPQVEGNVQNPFDQFDHPEDFTDLTPEEIAAIQGDVRRAAEDEAAETAIDELVADEANVDATPEFRTLDEFVDYVNAQEAAGREADIARLEADAVAIRAGGEPPSQTDYVLGRERVAGEAPETRRESIAADIDARIEELRQPVIPRTADDTGMRESFARWGGEANDDQPQRIAARIRQEAQTDSPEFRKWFGKSKIVDGSGKPMVLYHGTTESFTAFDPKAGGRSTLGADAKGALFFTTSPEVAEDFAGYQYRADGDKIVKVPSSGANIIPAFVRLENPDVWEMGGGAYDEATVKKAIKEAKAAGHDGVVFTNMRDGSISTVGAWKKSHVVVAFNPTQIKSAIGNSGRFSRKNSDIRAAAFRSGPFDEIAVGQKDLFDLRQRVREADGIAAKEIAADQATEFVGQIAPTQRAFQITKSGDPIAVVIAEQNGDTLEIADIVPVIDDSGNEAVEPNALGAVAMRSVLRDVLTAFPGVKKVSGNRVTGARGLTGADGQTSIKVDAVEAEGSRDELARLVAEGADLDTVTSHPAFVAAVQEVESRPSTQGLEGYGTPEFEAARVFNFDGEEVVGYDAAISRLVDVAESYAGGEVARDRVATIVLGPPAAGKSSLSEVIARARKAAIVDPDDAKKVLPEYDNGIGANSVHEESASISRRVLEEMADGRNIILPKVGQSPEGIGKLIEAFRGIGYRVELANLAVSYDNAFRRMVARFLKTGRIINPEYVKAVGEKPAETYRALKTQADDFLEVDGNGASLDTATVLDGEGDLAETILGPRRDRDAGTVEGAGERQAPDGRQEVDAGGRTADGPRPPEGVRAADRPLAANERVRAQTGVAARPDSPAGFEPLEALVDRLVDAAPDDTPFRGGRLRSGRRASGEADLRTGSVRMRDTSDLQTQAHEIAHIYEAKFGPMLEAIKIQHEVELRPLAYQGAAPGTELSEGFAEFLRHYVTNAAYVEKQAPGFLDAFETFMLEREPDKLQTLLEVREGFEKWLNAPSGAAVASDIVTDRRRGIVGRLRTEVQRHGFKAALGRWVNGLYTGIIDQNHPINLAVKELLRIAEDNTGRRYHVKAVDNPYKLQRLAAGASQGGMIDLQHGVVPYRGTQPVGPSLFDALELALGRKSIRSWDDTAVQEFGAYLVSRRAVVEWDRFTAGEIPNPPGKFSKGDYEQAVADLEVQNPAWRQAADLIYQFQDNLLRKKFEAGFLTQEQFDTFRQKLDYVPFQRDMRDFGEEIGVAPGTRPATTRGTGRAGIVNAFRGSNRAIINPLETIMRDALETSNLIARNEVFRSLDALARMAGPGSASIAERIKPTEMRVTRLDVVDVIEQVAKDQRLDPRDIQTLRDTVDNALGGDTTATLFRAGDINEKGEPIIYLWQNGRKMPLRLADGQFGRELYGALTGLSKPGALDPLVNALTVPSLALRAGITTSPDFLLANYLRDQLSAWTLSDDGFIPFVGGARGMVDEVTNSDWARLYSQAGGIIGGANVSSLSAARIDRDIQSLRKKGYAVQRLTSLKGLIEITELSETGTRVELFRKAFQRAKGDGLTDYEAIMEAAFSARDIMDFDRHGSKMLAARKLVTFLNASLQGIDKSARVLIAPLFKLHSGKPLTPGERRQLGAAAKAWAKVSVIGTIGVFQSMLYRDDPEYEEISDYMRATHWMFKLPMEGNVKDDDGLVVSAGGSLWLAIPKPFDLAVLSNIFERAYERVYKNDPTAWERMRAGFMEVLAPPTNIPGLDVGAELLSGYDFWREKSIVPEQMQGFEAALQWNAYTSEFGKALGKAINVSPMYIDHAITGFGGSWGRTLLNASNTALRDNAAEGGPEDWWITRRFVKDASRGSTSSEKFWDLIGRGGGEWDRIANTYKEMTENGALGNADAYLQGKPDSAVAYAILQTQDFTANERRIHPLRRAKDAVTTISKLRQEMTLDRVVPIDDAEAGPLALTPKVKGQVDDVLSRLSMIEARNALIATGVPGWAQKRIMDTGPVWRELEAASPVVFEEIQNRYDEAKVYSEAGVRRAWPEAQKRILEERNEAILSDLAGEAKHGD